MFTSSRNTDMVKGVGIGLAVGTAAVLAGSKMMTRSGRKMCKKNAMKCMKGIEDMMSAVSMMK